MEIIITTFYLLCGFLIFLVMKIFETEEFAKIRRIWRVLIRLTYLLLWPIYFIGAFGIFLWEFIKMLVE